MKPVKIYKYLFIGILLMPFAAYSQQRKIDSLLTLIKAAREDTNKVNALNTLAHSLSAIKPDSTILLAQQALALAEKLGWEKGESDAYSEVGVGYGVKDDYTEEIANYQNGLKIAEKIGYKKGQASTLCNIGNVYYEQGDYLKALDYYQNGLKMSEETGDKKTQARNLGNIGNVYNDQGDYHSALDYDLKSLEMAEEAEDRGIQAVVLSNIGNVYYERNDYHNALDYDLKSLEMAEVLGNKQVQAADLGSMGNIYHDQGDYRNALYYELEAFEMAKKVGDKQGQAADLGGIGSLYTKTGKFKNAEEYLKKAIHLDSAIGNQNDLRHFEQSISQLYDTTARYKLALTWYKKAAALKDTLFNIDKNKALTRNEFSYQYDKKEAEAKAQQDKKDAVADADKRKQLIVIWAVFIGLLLVLIFSSLLFSRFKVTERQKKLIEKKNKEVLDSIMYAKRLQDAILPPLNTIKKYFPESFVLYKPKDIVAGDFYWMERAPLNPPERGTKGSGNPSLEGGEAILIAVADCTGHGVPGAMVSVICSNALNRAVKEFHIMEPGKILDKVRELVVETFEKSESEVKDGMDISLCAINTQTKEIRWSGAYNPLWYLQNNELKEVAPDKQPIGKFSLPKPFNTTFLKLQKGDTLYLFTDGYADQFGGPKGKKFKYKQFQEKLLAMSSTDMDKQKEMLDETIESWKGSLEQVDDILVMGIRV